MSTSIQIRCPGCQKPLQVPTSLLGSTVRCKFCGHSMQLKKKEKEAEVPTAAPPPPLPKNRTKTEPAPIVEALPTAVAQGGTPFGDLSPVTSTPVIATAGNSTKYRGKYKGPAKNGWIQPVIIGLSVLLVGGIVTVLVVKPDLIKKLEPNETNVVSNNNLNENKTGTTTTNNNTPINVSSAPFPRRLLSINVNNYLFLNPLQYGETASRGSTPGSRRDLHTALTRLADGWKIPREQLYELTDIVPADGDEAGQKAAGVAKLPLKEVIQESVKRFCESSRTFDRVVILFTGHALEVKGKGYFVPVEGELDNVDSLIPIDELYEHVKACPAQQKIVIWDVCRYDPGRGNERPSAGKMTAKLEQLLHEAAPEDTDVLTACSKDQYSYEFEYAEVESKPIFGSIFLNQFIYASSAGALSKGSGKTGSGIQSQEDPIPVQNLVEYVTKQTAWFSKELVPTMEAEEAAAEPEMKKEEPKKKAVETNKDDEMEMKKDEMAKEKEPATSKKKAVQLPKFTAARAKTKQIPIDLAMTPKKWELPTPPAIADATEVKLIFEEVMIPPIKSSQKGVSLDTAFPFPAETMAAYKADVTSEDLMRKNSERFKFRLGVIDVIKEMRAQLGKENALREEIRGESNDAAKREILEEQRAPAVQQLILEELKAKMEALKADREKESSKRWQAHYDYLLAQIKMRLAFLSEYNLMLGKVRKDELPTLDPALKHKGWKLAAVEKMKSPREIRDLVDEAKEILNTLSESHPNTPWAVLAKRDKNISLGLEWQPSSFGE